MNWVPRSLFGRNLLLIALLMTVALICSVLLVRELVLRPRLEQIADAVAQNVAALRNGLQALPAEQRAAFVAAFNGPPAAADGEAARPPLSPTERRFLRVAAQRLAGAGVALSWRRADGASVGVNFQLDGQTQSLRLPALLPARESNGTWIAASLSIAVLALLGAWAIQRRLNRPLARVVHAAGELGRGEPAPLLPEDGPIETATLARSVNQLGANLASAERERALMLAGVSHDLRTPLTKLRLGIEILSAEAEPALLTSMTRSVEEMDAIIGQFLDFARADVAEPAAVTDVDALLRRVAAACADHGQVLAVRPGAPAPLPLRAQALQRAIANLVENAFRHGAAPVELCSGGDARTVWVEVVDRGPGIAASEADALKQPFRRAQAARAGVPGAGLGLAIVERVVRAHGGRFDLIANAPQGLRARISLPRSQLP